MIVAQASTSILSEDTKTKRDIGSTSRIEEVGGRFEQLSQLLLKYDVAFGEPTVLGRTDMVLHTINTADAAPFKIPYRRLPLKKF